MALLGSWFGFQFIGTLYMQNLRGWSPIEMALAFLPGRLIVAFGSTQIGRLVNRIGTTLPDRRRVRRASRSPTPCSCEHRRRLQLPVGDAADLPPLRDRVHARLRAAHHGATGDVANEEQGLASGLVYTSSSSAGRSASPSPPR